MVHGQSWTWAIASILAPSAQTPLNKEGAITEGSGEGPSTNGLSYDRDGQNKKWVEVIAGGGSRRGDLLEIQDCGTGVTKAKALKQTAVGSRRGDELREKGGSR